MKAFSPARATHAAASKGDAPSSAARAPRSTWGNQARLRRLATDIGGAPPVIHDVLQSPGQKLDPVMRARFEARLGADFGDVRLHLGAHAANSADAVDARAYTVGRDIVFGAGMFAPATPDGGRLLAHELAHVAQQRGTAPLLQRDPNDRKPRKPGGPQKAEKTYPEYQPADSVAEISREGDTWTLSVDGRVSTDSLLRLIWPHVAPPGVEVTLLAAVIEPIERGKFTLTGLTYEMLQWKPPAAMEPSIAKLFTEHGLEDETTDSEAVRSARAAFRAQHQGYDEWTLNTIDFALRRITKRNPDLLISYYKYYETHALRDEGKLTDGIDFNSDKDLGGTAGGDTRIRSDLLKLETPDRFPTSDRVSLLGGTLIHEYTHTPQPKATDPVTKAQFEAKAYGVEVFFSYRMGDAKRADFIEKRSFNDKVDQMSGGDKIYQATQAIMETLYRMIDNGGPAAVEARAMSTEFISKNSADYGPKLKAFISSIPDAGLIP